MNDIELNQLNIKENEKLFSQTKTESNQKKRNYFFLSYTNNKLYNIFLKLKNKIKINNSSFLIMLLTILLNIYGLYYYLKSLKGCKNSRAFCLQYYSLDLMFHIFIYILISSISFSIIFIFSFWNFISFSNFLIIMFSYITLAIYDHNDNFENHGYYNFYGFIILIVIEIPIFLYLSYTIKLIYKKLYKQLIYLVTPLAIILIICYIRYIVLLKCYGYHIGLNGVKIDDDPNKYSCFYDYPKKCYIDILSHLWIILILQEIVKQLEILKNKNNILLFI